MTRRIKVLVEIEYMIFPKLNARRARTHRGIRLKRPATTTGLMVIERAELSKDAIETALKRSLQRRLIKNSLKLIAYRPVEDEVGNYNQINNQK